MLNVNQLAFLVKQIIRFESIRSNNIPLESCIFKTSITPWMKKASPSVIFPHPFVDGRLSE